jgi:tRNA-uridine 2-sulfurtransferase
LKIAVAMSGGVDSSVAAVLLKEQGHEVIGLTMQLVTHGSSAINDARSTAEVIGIKHYTADFHDLFSREIIDYFCREYSLGRTPNPCVLCNRLIKFGALWEKAAELGVDYIATGHYAQIEREGDNIYLKKGADAKKDQSYFLCRLTQEQLRHVLFPIGHLTKTEVKIIAQEKGLPAASRPESQEICFIPDNDHAAFVKNYLAESPPGPIIDGRGNILGKHRGIASYTIGQRHGLGIAAAEPLYVTALDAERNAIVVGTKEDTYSADLIATDLNWIKGDMPEPTVCLKAKVRYRHAEASVTIKSLDENHLYVNFAEPQMAVTPGQTIAFYNGDTVMGGGTILKQGDRL